jgi:hypothetical protein
MLLPEKEQPCQIALLAQETRFYKFVSTFCLYEKFFGNEEILEVFHFLFLRGFPN